MTEKKAPAELRDTLIQSLVFETFGLRRYTQDSPIKPDVWVWFLKLARWKMRLPDDRKAGAEDQRVSLILTPKQSMSEDGRPAGHAGQLAERIRAAILGKQEGRTELDDTPAHAAERLAEQQKLKPFCIAATSRHVAIKVTFAEMMTYLLPLTYWWPKQSYADKQTLLDALNEEVLLHTTVQVALVRLDNTEFLRFAAITSVISRLLASTVTADELEALASILAPLERRNDGDDFLDEDDFDAPFVNPYAGRKPVGINDARVEQLRSLWRDYESTVPDIETARKRIEDDKAAGRDDVSIWSMQLNRRAYRQAKPPMRTAVRQGQQSSETVKADAAKQLFSIKTAHLAWAIIDTGIDANHRAFLQTPVMPDADITNIRSRIVTTIDFTLLQGLLSEGSTNIDDLLKRVMAASGKTGEAAEQIERQKLLRTLNAIRDENINERQLDWSLLEPLIRIKPELAPVPSDPHGTHVAGILGGNLPGGVTGDENRFEGVCPDIKLYDLRVFNDEPSQSSGGDEFTVLAALDYVAWLNRDPSRPAIHGVNLSLAIPYIVDTHACGRTPICDACDRLVWNGTVVVAAAGNSGFDKDHKQARLGVGFRGMTITDPGNAQEVITVGATHHTEPHTYGVSYFSSRGPTGDGRMKPDIVAPGEKIRSTAPGNKMLIMDGTSMAAPHVSGVCALLMGRYSELIGEPERIKKILMSTATDLERERHFQGAGLVDALRALQSV